MGTTEVPAWPDRLLGTDDLPFVGRRRELHQLGAAWEHARDGRRRVVFVGGEPGAGKSHLVATGARHYHDAGAAVALGTSFAELGAPFQPLSEVLRGLLAHDPALLDTLPVRTRWELSRLLGTIPAANASDPAAERTDDRRLLFDAVVEAIRVATTRRPLVMILDDLHWAGRPSLELLVHLVRSTSTERLLVLATYRTTAPDHTDEVGKVVAELLRHDGVEQIELEGLATDDIVDLLVVCGSDEHRAREAAHELERQTGGNAFLLRELWHHLDAHGGLDRFDASGLSLPRSIGDTIELRLRELPDEHLRVLELAAVIGHDGDAATLVTAARTDIDTALAAIGAGVAIGVLRLGDPGAMGYAFVHDLARHVLIDRLGPGERARLHARVALALESHDADGYDHGDRRRAARVAHHWVHAGLYDQERRAAHWLAVAGAEAERSLAFEEAAAHYEQAAGRLAPGDEQRKRLLLAAASNSVRSGAFAEGRRLYELLVGDVDPEIVARAAIGYEDASWRPGLPGGRAVELLERAARLLVPDDPLHIAVLAALGRALTFVGRNDQARSIGATAIERARAIGDERLLAVALQASLWHNSVVSVTEGPALLERTREGARLALRIGDGELLGQAATYRGSVAYCLGLPDEWRDARQQLETVRRETAQTFYAYMAGCSDHAEAFLRGDFAAAEQIAEGLLDLGGAFGTDYIDGLHGLQSFMVRRATGRLEEIRPLIRGDEPLDGSSWEPGLLALYTELGLRDAAQRVVDHLLRTDLEDRSGSEWPAVLTFLADAVFELGDELAAHRLLPALEPFAGGNLTAGHFVAVFGSADRLIGMLLGVVGSGAAADHFEAALAMDRHMGAAVHEAETLARWAAAVPGDPDAPARRRRAHELAERLGMMSLARRTAEPTPDGDATEPSMPHGLSARELEVLRCLARGASNREIAADLYIAENTVANHVRSIMMKTGTANRTQAAIYATRRSLV